MTTRLALFAVARPLLFAGAAGAQFPLVDMMTDNQSHRGNPQMRATFIDKIAAPVANKMLDSGMLP